MIISSKQYIGNERLASLFELNANYSKLRDNEPRNYNTFVEKAHKAIVLAMVSEKDGIEDLKRGIKILQEAHNIPPELLQLIREE